MALRAYSIGATNLYNNLLNNISNSFTSTTNAGTYTGTGVAFTQNIGFFPDLVIVKSETGATRAIWVSPFTWFSKAYSFDDVPAEAASVEINANGTMTVGTSANVNTSGATYHWFAYKDNGTGGLIERDHAGNTQTTRSILHSVGYPLKAAWFKRDNTEAAVIALKGRPGFNAVGVASTTCEIGDNGAITVGQGADINIWSTNRGEACTMIGFGEQSNSVYVTTYIGTGAVYNLFTPFENLEAILFFPRGSTGLTGAIWMSTLAATVTLSTTEETATTVGAQCVLSVANGRVQLGTSARVNQLGTEYVMIAFARRRQGIALSNLAGSRPLKNPKHVQLNTTSYISCGSSSSLAINGAISIEWFGAHTAPATALAAGSAANDSNTQIPLIWRSNGSDGVVGSVSWGMQMQGPHNGATIQRAGLAVAVTNIVNQPQSGTFDVDDNQPWNTGIGLETRQPIHYMCTHDGNGFWNVYVNGKLVKERNRDMTQATTPRPNIESGAAHVTAINARFRGGAFQLNSQTQWFMGARVYNRRLSADEVANNYNSWFADNNATATGGFVEEWLASGASGTSVPATVSSANNGTIVGPAVINGDLE
jgi:hypothetical protein